jgi:hypothetical protein
MVGEGCFPAQGETFCHYILRNNVFVGACCPDKDDTRSCTRRFSALLLPFVFMYWLSIVEDISEWTHGDGWHNTLYSMLILAGQLICLVIAIKVYQCMMVDCCKMDDEHKQTDAGLMATLFTGLTNLEIFATIDMTIACVVATFHMWGQTPLEADGVTTMEHGELLKLRLKRQFIPIFVLYIVGIDFCMNAAIFLVGKCVTCGGSSGGSEKEPLNPDGESSAVSHVSP